MLFKSVEIAVISEKAKFKGSLGTPGTLTIFGTFHGRIKSGILEIGKDGKVFGRVEAENVTIAGYFEGELVCYGPLAIAKRGTVRGRIAYGSLVLENGGLLDAEVFQLESTDKKLVPFHSQKAKIEKYEKKSFNK
jgi:cytoskeletal protein CcmA (bactofilin family)